MLYCTSVALVFSCGHCVGVLCGGVHGYVCVCWGGGVGGVHGYVCCVWGVYMGMCVCVCCVWGVYMGMWVGVCGCVLCRSLKLVCTATCNEL